MKRHDLSSMFPDMQRDAFAKLVSDIAANGLLDPIIIWNGEVVDGWHRYQACLKAGVEPRFVEFDGDDRKALAMVVSRNARRRHLSDGAIADVTKLVLGWHEAAAGRGGDRRTKGSTDTLITSADIAEASGLSLSTVKRHTSIEQKAPGLLPMVRSGEIGLATAARIAESVPVELLEAPTKTQVNALAHAMSERPQARCTALLRAAREFRSQWEALTLLPQSAETESALHEAMFHIRQCRAPN
jgi:ParB-like chromosome segregation protein Spo0J